MMPHLTILDSALVFARIMLSVSVTVHVLSTKRDTAASAGWIGICWLMPLTGFVLYVMFGVNRVRRLARRLINDHRWSGRGRSPISDIASMAPLRR